MSSSSRIEFVVRAHPEPKGSTSAFPIKTGAFDLQGHPKYRCVLTSANPELKAWEKCVHAAAVVARNQHDIWQPLVHAVKMTVVFWLPRPASVTPSKRPLPSVKPDLSKLVRGIEDALTGVLLADDALITTTYSFKRYTNGEPCARVILEPDGPAMEIEGVLPL